jgi:hypothetical protein
LLYPNFRIMIKKWRLYEYVSPNGRRAIYDWRRSLPIGDPRADLDTFLRDMVKIDIWEPPQLEALHGAQQGLTELRWKSGRLPHRILGYQPGDHEYLMLIGCTHRESYDPQGALETVLVRRRQIQEHEASIDEYQLILNR